VEPRYLKYLENFPGHPSPATLRQLATALRTTPAALLGAGQEAPPGRNPSGSCWGSAGRVERMVRARGDLDFDAVVPVPMHRAKVRRRGYNQAELLARALALRIGVPCETNLLTKTRDLDAQSKLPRVERSENVRGAFLASPRVKSRRILLIDDVCTTGATIRACAGELVRAGAARVAAAVVAKTE